MFKFKPAVLIIIWGLLLALLFSVYSLKVGKTYNDKYSYYFDAVSYAYMNAELYQRLETESRFSLIKHEWLRNDRQPFRTAYLLFLNPKLLSYEFGYLVFTMPILAMFLILMGWIIYKRTNSIAFALSCMLLFFGIKEIYSFNHGLIPNWLDFPSALLACGGVICLFLSDKAKYLGWIVSFSVLCSLSFLSRYTAGPSVFLMCGPIFVWYLFLRWRNKSLTAQEIIFRFGLSFLICIVMCGYFAFHHLESNVHFYTVYGYAKSKGIPLSFEFISETLLFYPGTPLICFLLFLLAFFMMRVRKNSVLDWNDLWFHWPAVAHILFMLIIVQVIGGIGSLLWSIPLIFLSLVSPFPMKNKESVVRLHNQISILIAVVSCILVVRYGYSNYQYANNPSDQIQKRQQLNESLGKLVSDKGDHIIWNTYFDEYGWIPSVEAFYRFKKLPVPAGQDYFFSKHETVWKGNWPGKSPHECAIASYKNTSDWVHVAVILREADSAKTLFNNEYSSYVAGYYSTLMPTDSNWKKIFSISAPKYGIIDGYENLFPPDKEAYWRLIRNEPLFIKENI